MHAAHCACRGATAAGTLLGTAAATILGTVFATTANGSEIGKVALLSGSQENPPISTEAAGCARVLINTEDNTLSYYIAFSGLTSQALDSHIHGPADPGINGSVRHTLPAGNPKVGVWTYSEEFEADILNGRMYINIHTATFQSGELRGQIVDLVATIDNVQEVPDSGSAATGFGLFNIDTIRNELDYYIAYASLGSTETGAHIHGFALHTVNAGILHPLPLGVLKVGTWTYSEPDEKRILDGETYVNIHSVKRPGGEIRGQIVRTVVPLDGTQQNPPVDSTGHGCALVSRDDDEDILSYHLVHANLTGSTDQEIAESVLVEVAGGTDIVTGAISGVRAVENDAAQSARTHLADRAVALSRLAAEHDRDVPVVNRAAFRVAPGDQAVQDRAIVVIDGPVVVVIESLTLLFVQSDVFPATTVEQTQIQRVGIRWVRALAARNNEIGPRR